MIKVKFHAFNANSSGWRCLLAWAHGMGTWHGLSQHGQWAPLEDVGANNEN